VVELERVVVMNAAILEATDLDVVNGNQTSCQIRGGTLTSEIELLKISIAILEERVGELEDIVRRLHNTVHFQKKHSGEDGFGYWQVG